MNKQVQMVGGVVVLVALAGIAWLALRPTASGDLPDVGPRVKPEVEALRDRATSPKVVPTPSPAVAPVVQVVLDPGHPFLKLPAHEVPDIPNSVKDPLGVLPITSEALEMSVDEMRADLEQCRDKHMEGVHRSMTLGFHINSEVPPEDYGVPDGKPYGIIRAAKVMDSADDHTAFESCVTNVMKDILYDKPPGDGVRVNWTVDFS